MIPGLARRADGQFVTTPANLVANRIQIKPGVPYSFDDRPFMKAVFDDPYPRIGLKTARQISKSTFLASDAIINCEGFAPYAVLVLTPSQDQSRKFSYDRLGPTIEYSPSVKAQMDPRGLDNVFEKSFKSGSKIYISYAKENADRVRGITADQIDYDEIQDMNLRAVEAVTKESLFTSRWKRRRYSGTPKSFSNGIEQLIWKQSDQREWMVRCRHHAPVYHQKLTLKNVGKSGPACDRCGRALNTLDGLWVATSTVTSQGKEPRIHGYHLPQIIFPTTGVEVSPGRMGFLDWDEFLSDLQTQDEATILNEKFGESADSEERPVKEDELRAMCDETREHPVAYADWMINEPTFAGVDWGYGIKSATVLTIGQFDPANPKEFRYVFMKRYFKKDADPNSCIPDILSLMAQFRVMRCHADFGSGLGLNSQIEDARGEDFITTNYWSSSIGGKKIKFDLDLNRYVLNRSVHITRFFQAIKRRQLKCAFRWADFRPFAQDIMHVFREERRNGDPYYDHKPDEPDDSMHAMIYCWLIASFTKFQNNGVEYVRGEHDPYRS